MRCNLVYVERRQPVAELMTRRAVICTFKDDDVECRMAYRNVLIVGTVVGLINFLVVTAASFIYGGNSAIGYWYEYTLIATFPLGMLCAWLLSNMRRNVN